MTHYLSCGHELSEDEEGNELCVNLALAATTCDYDGYKHCIHYGSYCLDCAKELEEDGWVLHNEEEEIQWLSERVNL